MNGAMSELDDINVAMSTFMCLYCNPEPDLTFPKARVYIPRKPVSVDPTSLLDSKR